MNIRVKVVGLAELERKLGYSVLMAPAMDEARDTIVARVLRPLPAKGRGRRKGMPPGAGVINNTLTPRLITNGAVIDSTLNSPRLVGTAWGRANTGIVRAMAPNVLRKAVQRIEETWVE